MLPTIIDPLCIALRVSWSPSQPHGNYLCSILGLSFVANAPCVEHLGIVSNDSASLKLPHACCSDAADQVETNLLSALSKITCLQAYPPGKGHSKTIWIVLLLPSPDCSSYCLQVAYAGVATAIYIVYYTTAFCKWMLRQMSFPSDAMCSSKQVIVGPQPIDHAAKGGPEQELRRRNLKGKITAIHD